jgi:transcriptional regulator with XRE-family HTH domain
MNYLFKFIQEHPALNVSQIARDIGVQPRYLSEILKGDRGLTSDKAFKIARVLTRYGLKLKDWFFEEHSTDFPLSLFAHKFINEERIIEKEGVVTLKAHVEKREFNQTDFFEFIKQKDEPI